MDSRIKNYLGVALIIGVLVFALAAWNYSRTFEPSSFRSFTVSAEGKVSAVPDIAVFTFGVISEGGLAGLEGLKDENAKKVNAMIDYLKDQGVDKKDIKTLSFNVYPKYSSSRCYVSPCPEPEIVGYTVSQMVEVKVRNLEDAGKLLSGVVDRGANNVSGLNFTIDKPDELENEARKEAFEKARDQAQAIAKAGGFRLGKLISIDESLFGKGLEIYARMEAGGLGGGTDLAIEPGEEEIRVNIMLRYEIK